LTDERDVPEASSRPLFVLIVEDQEGDFELVAHELRRAGFSAYCERVETESEYVAKLEQQPDIILADYALPGFGALRALELLENRPVHIPFIVLTGFVSEDTVVKCIKLGAADYLLKTGCCGWAQQSSAPSRIVTFSGKNALRKPRFEGATNAFRTWWKQPGLFLLSSISKPRASSTPDRR
jgi:CheY-like chemotaxis protein